MGSAGYSDVSRLLRMNSTLSLKISKSLTSDPCGFKEIRCCCESDMPFSLSNRKRLQILATKRMRGACTPDRMLRSWRAWKSMANLLPLADSRILAPRTRLRTGNSDYETSSPSKGFANHANNSLSEGRQQEVSWEMRVFFHVRSSAADLGIEGIFNLS